MLQCCTSWSGPLWIALGTHYQWPWRPKKKWAFLYGWRTLPVSTVQKQTFGGLRTKHSFNPNLEKVCLFYQKTALRQESSSYELKKKSLGKVTRCWQYTFSFNVNKLCMCRRVQWELYLPWFWSLSHQELQVWFIARTVLLAGWAVPPAGTTVRLFQ